MPDAVTAQTIFDGTRYAVLKFTNISDGTGETAALKVDVSELRKSPTGQTCTGVAIEKIHIVTIGMGVDVLWDATTDVLAMSFGESDFVSMDFSSYGGITNNAGTGKTGDILFTTVGAAAGDRYTVILELLKSYG